LRTRDGFLVYGALKLLCGIRLDADEGYAGRDLSIHKTGATPERERGG
jgi:Amt family ammonium transporter